MSFAEIILRIGASIGGWLIFLGLCLTLAVLPEADCDPASDELWRGTLFFGFLSALGLLLVGRGLAWSNSLRWFAVPAGMLAVYAAIGIVPAVSSTTIEGGSLCAIANPTVGTLSGIEATRLERVWPLVQLAILGFGLRQSVRCWMAAKNAASLAPRV